MPCQQSPYARVFFLLFLSTSSRFSFGFVDFFSLVVFILHSFIFFNASTIFLRSLISCSSFCFSFLSTECVRRRSKNRIEKNECGNKKTEMMNTCASIWTEDWKPSVWRIGYVALRQGKLLGRNKWENVCTTKLKKTLKGWFRLCTLTRAYSLFYFWLSWVVSLLSIVSIYRFIIIQNFVFSSFFTKQMVQVAFNDVPKMNEINVNTRHLKHLMKDVESNFTLSISMDRHLLGINDHMAMWRHWRFSVDRRTCFIDFLSKRQIKISSLIRMIWICHRKT